MAVAVEYLNDYTLVPFPRARRADPFGVAVFVGTIAGDVSGDEAQIDFRIQNPAIAYVPQICSTWITPGDTSVARNWQFTLTTGAAGPAGGDEKIVVQSSATSPAVVFNNWGVQCPLPQIIVRITTDYGMQVRIETENPGAGIAMNAAARFLLYDSSSIAFVDYRGLPVQTTSS